MKHQTFLAFDVGLKRTGVASGQTHTKSAQPAGQLVVNNGRFDWPEVDKAINAWRPDAIVIGDPKTSNTHLNKTINRLISHIQQTHKLPIVRVDETLTSVAANSELQQRDLSFDKKIAMRDQIAACLILETYLNQLS